MKFEQFALTILALDELLNCRYDEVWIGDVDCPHWDWKSKSNIIASPKNRKDGTPSLWLCDKKFFGEMSCGNGFKNADQMQTKHNLIVGYYKYENNEWQTDIFKTAD